VPRNVGQADEIGLLPRQNSYGSSSHIDRGLPPLGHRSGDKFEIGYLGAQLLRAIHFLRDIRNLVGFAADETEQRCGERPADFGSFSFPRPSRSLLLFRRW
jgi:hypothetical protein